MDTLAPIGPVALPQPRVPVAVRAATAADLPFVDKLQKLHTKQVGFMPRQQLAGKIDAGNVLIAEGVVSCQLSVASEEGPTASPLTTGNSQLATPLGYVIATDRYFKRDDVGIVYQVNVVPSARRGLVGATLLRAVFERAAYGCRLFCCWCAQDIEANRFWESMGFVPLAFRAGSRGKNGRRPQARVHIFWQRRVRAGDSETPYWFPAQTNAGSIREDRLVLPIPPGTHWRDVMPIVLPTAGVLPSAELPVVGGQLPVKRREGRSAPARETGNSKLATSSPTIAAGGLRMAVPKPPAAPEPEAKRGPKAKASLRRKNDPKLVAAARELRDRWLERVNAPGDEAALPSRGKYDVSRALSDLRIATTTTTTTGGVVNSIPLLPAPAAA